MTAADFAQALLVALQSHVRPDGTWDHRRAVATVVEFLDRHGFTVVADTTSNACRQHTIATDQFLSRAEQATAQPDQHGDTGNNLDPGVEQHQAYTCAEPTSAEPPLSAAVTAVADEVYVTTNLDPDCPDVFPARVVNKRDGSVVPYFRVEVVAAMYEWMRDWYDRTLPYVDAGELELIRSAPTQREPVELYDAFTRERTELIIPIRSGPNQGRYPIGAGRWPWAEVEPDRDGAPGNGGPFEV